jgi:hypothetical protein
MVAIAAPFRRLRRAYPFPQRRRAGQPRVGNQGAVVELAGGETDRAYEQLAAAVRELLEEPLDRGAALAGDRFGVSR